MNPADERWENKPALNGEKATKDGDTLETRRVPQYFRGELMVQEVLGKGCYSVVHRATVYDRTAIEDQNKSHQLAIKTVRRPSKVRQLCSVQAIENLSREASILECIEHPNIVQLRGISRHLPAGTFNSPCHVMLKGKTSLQASGLDNYFILLEKLDRTLDDRIMLWKEQESHFPRIGFRRCQWKSILRQRLPAAVQIAKALRYLHNEKKIVFRDLKAENIGFVEDHVKLFDFGFAVKTGEVNTGLAGSPRYMAPESLHVCGHYDPAMDIFAFGLVLWQICTLETPFAKFSPRDHYERVFQRGERPPLQEWWPEELQNLLRRCWLTNPSKRPSIQEVLDGLAKIKEIVRPSSGRMLLQ